MKKLVRQKTMFISLLVLILALGILPPNDNHVYAAQAFKGIAIKDPTNVYSDTSRGSKVLRSYSEGSILLYSSHSTDWYSAVVFINGQRHNGYIHKADVENIIDNQQGLKGIGLKNPTAVYQSASTNSKRLRTYASGSILYYKTLSNNWYEALVYINGKATIGYINKSDVENIVDNQIGLKGIGLKNPTAVYERASTDSRQLRTYASGSILYYKTLSNNWYEALIYINGKATTGYIHKSHVDDIVETQQSLKGIGLNNPTAVYARASTGSKQLRTYAEGSILYYKTFTSNWYEALVYIDGKATTGYIHTSHIEGVYGTSESFDGMSLKEPTNIYSRASRGSSVLRSYPEKRLLFFKTFSPNWYEATVIINGKATIGYIHRSDVSTDRISINISSYSIDYKRVVDIQMGRSPQVSGQNGGFVNASRNQVEHYVNSSNFNKNSNDYYQFLVLSQPADLNANEVNQKILFNHGTLTGQAKSFIDAGKLFNLNEAYLISHALLETGNGKSTLAQGVPVDDKGNVVPANQKVHTVYNMYGIGAVDKNPLSGGAKRAFNEGWFTPEEAIVGGAEFINTYITRGQDTLYKMRWNPTSPGYPQYATDVAWATKQTYNISRIYNLLDRYVLIYDVPKYANQPSSSGDPNDYLKISPTNTLMFRSIFNILPVTDEINEFEEVTEPVEEVDSEETTEPVEEVDSEETTEPVEEVDSEETTEPVEKVDPEETSQTDETVESEEIDEIIGFEELQIYGVSTDYLKLKDTPNDADSSVYVTIPKGTKLEIKSINGTWYETNYDGKVGWVNGDNVTLLNLIEVIVDVANIYLEANDSNLPVVTVNSGIYLSAVLTENDTLVQENEWYQVTYNGEELWINGGKNGAEYINVK